MTTRVQVNQVGRPAPRPRAEKVRLPLGQQMREAREAAGMTQKAVARRMFVSPGTVRCWEGDRRTPSVAMLDAYLQLVGATITLGATS